MLTRKNCISCDSKHLVEIIDLGEHAWCNNFLTQEEIGTEETKNLSMIFCNDCELFQINETFDKQKMFSNHTYLSGTTKSLTKHFYDTNKKLVEQFQLPNDSLIVDFGSNDGSALKTFKELGYENVIGVESAKNIADIANNDGISTINDYFNEACVNTYFQNKKAKVITCSGVFFHLERDDLHSALRGIKKLLDDNGVFVIHFMYLKSMIENLSFDGLYFEHTCIYSLKSLANLLKQYGLEIFDAEESEIHGGSMVVKVTHATSPINIRTERFASLEYDDYHTISLSSLQQFARSVVREQPKLKEYLQGLKDNCERVYALGAPAKSETLLSYFEIDNSLIECAFEINEMKIGLYTPISHLLIERENFNDIPNGSYILILAWNFFDEILKRNKVIKERKNLKFIMPFPGIRIV